MANVIKYGDYTIDADTIPAKSVNALLARGLAHICGNEVSSKVVSKIRSVIGADATKDAVKEYRTANDAKVTEWEHEGITEALKSLQDGTVGDRSFGPRGTALDTVIRQVATEELRAALKKGGQSLPSGKKTVLVATAANPNGEQFTGPELVARYVAANTERLTREANSRMSKAEKVAAINIG